MRLFVTGTDTGVGKSVVTACLAAAARARGSVVACKPVASGVPPGSAGEDAELLGRYAGHPPLVLAAFEAPLSPHRAAILEGRQVGDDVLDRIRALQADTVLVEGVGGWRVPLRIPIGPRPPGLRIDPDLLLRSPSGRGAGGEGRSCFQPGNATEEQIADPHPNGAALPSSVASTDVVGQAHGPAGQGAARELWVEDLARATAGPVLVVAADRLGVLNHTLLTLDAIRAAGLVVAGVALNRGAAAAPDDRSRTTNAEDLRLLARVPIVEVPPVDLRDPAAVAAVGEVVLRGIVGPAVGECG